MGDKTKPVFSGGTNIAIKVPPHLWKETVSFYRDVLGLSTDKKIKDDWSATATVIFAFGPNRLWIDRVDGLSQAEVWLEITSDDVEGASKHLEAAGVARRDEIEELPLDFEGFWIENPASIIHLVKKSTPS